MGNMMETIFSLFHLHTHSLSHHSHLSYTHSLHTYSEYTLTHSNPHSLTHSLTSLFSLIFPIFSRRVILDALAKSGSINSYDFARSLNVDHQDVIGAFDLLALNTMFD